MIECGGKALFGTLEEIPIWRAEIGLSRPEPAHSGLATLRRLSPDIGAGFCPPSPVPGPGEDHVVEQSQISGSQARLRVAARTLTGLRQSRESRPRSGRRRSVPGSYWLTRTKNGDPGPWSGISVWAECPHCAASWGPDKGPRPVRKIKIFTRNVRWFLFRVGHRLPGQEVQGGGDWTLTAGRVGN
jgi:hypothetical protein